MQVPSRSAKDAKKPMQTTVHDRAGKIAHTSRPGASDCDSPWAGTIIVLRTPATAINDVWVPPKKMKMNSKVLAGLNGCREKVKRSRFFFARKPHI